MIKRCVILILAAWLAGCGTIGNLKRMNQFDLTERQYRSLIKQSDLESASRLIDPDWLDQHPVNMNLLKVIRVTEGKVKRVVISKDMQRVYQEVTIRYYRNDQMVERTIQDHQKWQFNPETGQWLLISGLPPFK